MCEKRSEREERKNPMEKETSEKVPSIPKSEDDAKDIPRFLRSGEKRALGGSVALTSYPRSGNSMMRSLLESCTGLITGSDTVRFSFDIILISFIVSENCFLNLCFLSIKTESEKKA